MATIPTTEAERPIFSLVVCTYRRVEPLRRLLASLAALRGPSFEVLVVDQNPPGALDQVFTEAGESFRKAAASGASAREIRHLRSEPGLSRARNAGLAEVRGEWIAFPDDDCTYPPEILEAVLDQHARCGADALVGRVVGFEAPPLPRGGAVAELDRLSLWWKGMSAALFLRRELADAVGKFDPELGVGAGTPWGSGEESDYLVRALDRGFRLCRVPGVYIRHADPDWSDPALPESAAAYGRGRMRVLALRRYPLWFRLLNLCWPLLMGLRHVRSASRRAYYAGMWRGRWQGFRRPR